MQVIFDHLYSISSARDTGTLYAARNAINARNVTKDPSKNFYAAEELMKNVLDAYLVVGAMKHFGLLSVDGKPTENTYAGVESDNDMKKDYILKTIQEFIYSHVITAVPEAKEKEPRTATLVCHICGKKYVRKGALKKHTEKAHQVITAELEPTINKEDEDHVYNYTRLLLILLLLLHNHDNAIRLGDGARVLRLYKFFYLYFKVSHCPKYAYGTLELLAQVNHLLSPRMAHCLTWNRFVNHKGKLDTNLPMDLEVEHDNKYFKDDICAYRGEITEKSISRVSNSTQITESIVKTFDKITHIKCPSGVHTDTSIRDDVMHLVDQFKGLELCTKIP